jgi:hypothetical protein
MVLLLLAVMKNKSQTCQDFPTPNNWDSRNLPLFQHAFISLSSPESGTQIWQLRA